MSWRILPRKVFPLWLFCALSASCWMDDDPTAPPSRQSPVVWNNLTPSAQGSLEGAVAFLRKLVVAEQLHFARNKVYGLEIERREPRSGGQRRFEVGIPSEDGVEWVEVSGAFIWSDHDPSPMYFLSEWAPGADCLVYLGKRFQDDAEGEARWRENFASGSGWLPPDRPGVIACGPAWRRPDAAPSAAPDSTLTKTPEAVTP